MKNLAIASTILASLFTYPAVAENDRREIVGHVSQVIDGDTIIVNERRIRLWGIDAPELKQQCRERNGDAYDCGIEAKRQLEKIISGRDVACHHHEFNPEKGDMKPRVVAQCYVQTDHSDIGRAMVTTGYAFRTGHAGKLYADVQRLAFRLELGLWRGSFREPWHWRQANAE